MFFGLSTNSSMALRSASAGSIVFSCSMACTVRVVSCTAALLSRYQLETSRVLAPA